MKRRDRKPRKNTPVLGAKPSASAEATYTPKLRGRTGAAHAPTGANLPPPFVRAAIARLGRKHEGRLLRDADELHRRQKEPCDVTSRREADEIYRQFLNFV